MRYKVVLLETAIQEVTYDVEADSEESALEKVRNDEVRGDVTATFTDYEGHDGRMWDDVNVFEIHS